MYKKLIWLVVFCLCSLNVFAIDELYEQALKKNIQLSDDEKTTLSNGELGTGRYITGGVVSTALGFGVGHAIQGRWTSKGWIYTTGEALSVTALTIGMANCMGEVLGRAIGGQQPLGCSSSMLTVGYFGYMGFKIWEIVDSWRGGYVQMDQYDALKRKIQNDTTEKKKTVLLIPLLSPHIAGLSLVMNF